MDNRPTTSQRIASAAPYVCPVLGGGLGVLYVQIFHMQFVNPVFAIGVGAVAGAVVGKVLVHLIETRQLSGQSRPDERNK
ncbi:hypothetical protein [Shimia biformata]|uniref:hypothetical protein n=1 Tax=Shimia biformata TaxID=1294299 RepID=UPI00195270E7|nr:hypothetical protein [Shimia biformata]